MLPRVDRVSAPAQLHGRDNPRAHLSCANEETQSRQQIPRAPACIRPTVPRGTLQEPARPFPPPPRTALQARLRGPLRPKSLFATQRSAEILQYPHIFERRSPRSSDFASLHRLSRITFFGTLRRLPKFLHLLARNIRQCLSALHPVCRTRLRHCPNQIQSAPPAALAGILLAPQAKLARLHPKANQLFPHAAKPPASSC